LRFSYRAIERARHHIGVAESAVVLGRKDLCERITILRRTIRRIEILVEVKTYISPMPRVCTVITPFIVSNMTFTTFTEFDMPLRFPCGDYPIPIFSSSIFI